MFETTQREATLKNAIREQLENFNLAYLFNEDRMAERIEREAKTARNMYRAALDIADEILISYSKTLHTQC